MISGKWYLDRGMRLFRRFFSLNNHSLVSLLKYRDRDKVRLIRRLKRVNEQLSLLHRCDPEPRVLRFHETLRFLKYIKKPGNHHQRFESTPKEFPHDFELFYFFQADVLRRIRILLSLQTHLRCVYESQKRKFKHSFDYFSPLDKTIIPFLGSHSIKI